MQETSAQGIKAPSQGKLKSSLPLTAVLFPVARHHQQGLAEAVQQRGPGRRAGSTFNKHLPCHNSGQHTDRPADLGSDLGSQDLATATLHLSVYLYSSTLNHHRGPGRGF